MQPTRRRHLLAAGGGLGIALAVPRRAGAQGAVRGVVELFTSQGCSSCPPADRLAAELARDPTLVVLSLPVDYWDGLGWKDTFAQHAFTERQKRYAELRGDGEVYTPQAVISGFTIAVGSDRDAILSRIDAPLPVRVSLSPQGSGFMATIEGAPADAVVIVAPFLRAREVAIGRGENAHARVTYINIVRDLRVLGTVGGATRFSLPESRSDADAGVAVLVQAGDLERPGRILGAARS